MSTRYLAFVVACTVGIAGHAGRPVLEARGGSQQGGSQQRASEDGCAQIAALKLPDVVITETTVVPAASTGGVRAPHCRVNGVIGTEIKFSLLLPDQWNGKFMMGGGGGYVGSVQNQAIASLDAGYATVGTDSGHQGGSTDASWALDNLERRVNFGYLAVHRTAEVAKAIVRAHYGTPASRNYFMGCSNGGRQALMEAQRFPDDFDGIVAAAPAYDFGGLAAQFIKDSQTLFPDPKNVSTPLLSKATLESVEEHIVAACDGLDGVKDGLLEDPRRCTIDLGAITGLTAAQRTALEKIYAPTPGASGALYVGQPVGGEGEPTGWPLWISGGSAQAPPQGPSLRYAFGTQFFKYMVFNDPSWDYTKYDVSNARKDARLAATAMSATSTDLEAFKSRGRKLLMWHGWSDPALTALASVKYYEDVEARDPNLRDYFRMFMVPGVLHCFGGPGPIPSGATWWDAVADWVEKGKAPDRIVATKTANNVTRTRPLCPYPQHAVYAGTGSTDDERNFVCR